MNKSKKMIAAFGITTCMVSTAAMATCPNISHGDLTTALTNSVAASGGPSNGGLDFHMWATVVGTSGEVCQVTRTGNLDNDQWLGSRVISAQKAYTAIAFSTPDFALSTANLYSAVQPGGSLFGLQHSNPVDTRAAYRGPSSRFGTATDPMRNRRVGGINVFGGGLALYDAGGLVGAVGVSGDSSCADHNIAWRVREALAGFGAANVPAGVADVGAGTTKDNIFYLAAGEAPNGFKHPQCGGGEVDVNETITGANQPADDPD